MLFGTQRTPPVMSTPSTIIVVVDKGFTQKTKKFSKFSLHQIFRHMH